MNTEQKINAIMRYIVAETREKKNLALSEIKNIMEESEASKKCMNVDEVIEEILTEIGVPCHIIGYDYIIYTIKLVFDNPEYMRSITGVLYPAVAQKYNTKAVSVERAIRHGIECAWDRADFEVIEKYFGNTISAEKGKPTNSEFIARIANIVKRRTANGKK